MNLLFVCTGNTCRSPMAEGIARAVGREQHVDVVTLSTGLFCVPGAKVSEESVVAVQELVGEDISEHSSRPLKIDFVKAADYVLAMTEDHKKILLRQFPFDSKKIMTLAEFGGEDGDVVDPFGQSQEVYNRTAKQIFDYVNKGLDIHKDNV
ncbi:low molecular weight protein arginine phosphatase [Veillonella sp. CHU740]|uniref:low molecular weight protein arginine phosphatase n=1 Tax=Veillonella sp. CHU740 TaxID=2490950 RepID=UPI000F8D84B0|nr:low molecular weight protein arginine phosphatase [Veillonella sp. CHU740]